MAAIDLRGRALTHLVGQSRAYLQQLELARRELAELGADDLIELSGAVERAEAAVRAVDMTGTTKLRRD